MVARRRPTFIPQMKLRRVKAEHMLSKDPIKSHLCNILSVLSDLAAPRQALDALEDAVRLEAFQVGILHALQEQPRERAHPLLH